ncbi:hypothetical protein KP806_13865 [Paenibacillus sp. N4]|uniref:hypothetical protein n=1 Tax=Paenibacillus vietnamensis TaxID=2590547 RepID=UPI001CD0FE23|nr:hypothetical protein [Paenibacillus vietnamensis]MCA0756138.1 hypothetical protein [Paenibacillus vietnamensis]
MYSKLKAGIVSLSAVVLFSFGYSAYAANQHTYVIKEVNTTSATSGNINGQGQYGRIDAALNQGQNGRIALYKVISVWPDSLEYSIDLSESVKYKALDYWLEGAGTLFYIKATGDNDDKVSGNLWNYKP